MNTQPIADTMTNAINKMNALLSPETLLSRNTTKLSDMSEDDYELYTEAILTIVENSDAEFQTYDHDDDTIQLFEKEVGYGISVEFTRSYEFSDVDDCGNQTRQSGSDYKDSSEKTYYLGECID